MYLDVDGCITCDPESFDGIVTFEVTDGHAAAIVDWHPELFHEITSRFDVVWASSWLCTPSAMAMLEHDLGVCFDRVVLDYDEYVDTQSPRSCGKLLAVQRHFEADPAPFIWVDDHMGSEDREWAHEVGGITIAPSYGSGGLYAMLDILDLL